MGIDGFSMSNLGLNRNMNSSQLASEAEATARQALENQIADVDGVGKKEKAGRKDPDAAFNGTIPFIGEPKEKEDDESQENDSTKQDSTQSETHVFDEDDEGSQYHFKMNEEGMIEVWDSDTNSIVKTISPEDASNTLLHISKVPGIVVNKEA